MKHQRFYKFDKKVEPVEVNFNKANFMRLRDFTKSREFGFTSNRLRKKKNNFNSQRIENPESGPSNIASVKLLTVPYETQET